MAVESQQFMPGAGLQKQRDRYFADYERPFRAHPYSKIVDDRAFTDAVIGGPLDNAANNNSPCRQALITAEGPERSLIWSNRSGCFYRFDAQPRPCLA
jgi:hypothetical protein